MSATLTRTKTLAPLRSTVVDVDLDAIGHNFRVLRDRAKADVIAVIKADAYGHGSEAVGHALVDEGVAVLAVFTVEEALVLRAAGIHAPVLALLGATDRAETLAAVTADVGLAVWDVNAAKAIDDAAAASGRTAVVHVKVDTGLTRLGAALDSALATFNGTRDLRHLRVEGLYTHLATADEPDTSYDGEQLERFADLLRAVNDPPRYVHIGASAAVAAFGPMRGANTIRPGLSLYGLHTAPHLESALDLRPALEWRSRVRRVADVKKGTGVSYGVEYRLPRDGRIATVPVGYGDGLARALGRNGRLLLRGRPLPFAGRVCMDLVMLDVTDVPEAREGDEVVIIGRQGDARQSADDLAALLETINYEILTSISRRVPRRYRQGGRVVATRTLAGGYVRA